MKKPKPIKSILSKPQPQHKLNTEVKDHDTFTHAQRYAIDKIFAQNRKDPSVSFTKKDEK